MKVTIYQNISLL